MHSDLLEHLLAQAKRQYNRLGMITLSLAAELMEAGVDVGELEERLSQETLHG